MGRERGVHTLELTIAAAIVLLAASRAAPDEDGAGIEANETSAVAALEAIRAAQERFKAARVVDLDGDGVGEYGLLRELTRAMCARADPFAAVCGGHPEDPLLDPTYMDTVKYGPPGEKSPSGEIARGGYLFRVLLPGEAGDGIAERWDSPLGAAVDTDLAETTWCCYAWPKSYGVTGRRAFFINQTGTIVAADFPRYEGSWGLGTSNTAGAALREGGNLDSITGEVAADTTGRDGGRWTIVEPQTRDGRGRARGWFQSRAWYPNGRPDGRWGSFTLRLRRSVTRAHELLVCRPRRLQRGLVYELLLQPAGDGPPVVLGSGTATPAGTLVVRFDSRRDGYPAGLTTLAANHGGLLLLRRERDPDGSHDFVAGLIVPGATERVRGAGDRIPDNEAAVVATLHRIAEAQSQFQAARFADVNQDGVGEFGLLRELSGSYPVRTWADATGTGSMAAPPPLPAAFGRFNANNEVPHSGYLFHMILPGAAGIGVPEVSTGALASTLDSQLAATTWCCYAWPANYGATGQHTFFINELREITATGAMYYSGTGTLGTAAMAGAAFRAGDSLTRITGPVAVAATGRDGQFWRALPGGTTEQRSSATGVLRSTSGIGSAHGTFDVERMQNGIGTYDRARVELRGLAPETAYTVAVSIPQPGYGSTRTVVTDATGEGAVHWPGPDAYPYLDNVILNSRGGGAVTVAQQGTVVLRGDIPRFATPDGPNEPGASLVRSATTALVPGPYLRLKRGELDVRTISDAAGAHAVVTLSVTTFDALAERAEAFAIRDGVETPLGAIRLGGPGGAGTLRLDTSQGDAIPGGSLAALAGQTIEIRDETGAVLLTGTFPSVE
jgi:hypothetical protein